MDKHVRFHLSQMVVDQFFVVIAGKTTFLEEKAGLKLKQSFYNIIMLGERHGINI